MNGMTFFFRKKRKLYREDYLFAGCCTTKRAFFFFQSKIEKVSQMEVRRIIFVCLKSVKILEATPARNRKVNFGRDRTKL